MRYQLSKLPHVGTQLILGKSQLELLVQECIQLIFKQSAILESIKLIKA